ncbi:MAG: imelysin family protein [Myxococcota bacterium]
MKSIGRATLAVTMLLVMGSCGDDGSSTTTDPGGSNGNTSATGGGNNGGGGAGSNGAIELRQSILSNLGESVIIAEYQTFIQKSEALEQAVGAWAQSSSASDREAAQNAWREAMVQWQRCELYQVGPAGLMDVVTGGEDLRDEIYSWPLTNPCRVDQELVEEAFTDANAFTSEPINVRGLDALEYLLFTTGSDNRCAPNSSINRNGTWAALGDSEIDNRRARYAQTLASILSQQATTLFNAWQPEGGNFIGELSGAGNTSATYPTTQEALNALSDAMFYLEKETKDMKLAVPTGLSDSCNEDLCLDDLESPFALHSKENILANLHAFRLLLVGNESDAEEAPGFDDLLVSVGAEDVLTTLLTGIDSSIEALEAIDTSLRVALTNDPQAVVDAYNILQAALVEFKTRFVGVLDLEIPQRAEGDND